jgi:hypothetical protein
MAVNKRMHKIQESTQNIANQSFDDLLGVSVAEIVGFDGQKIQRITADQLTFAVYNTGGYTYVCEASPGTATSADKWRVLRIDSAGRGLYADGNEDFDNVADDYATLSYS